MSDREAARHLATLGLSPGVSPEDVRQTYRDLVNVWHPDRFGHHPRLRAKAEERLKDINAAYAWLVEHPEALARPPGGADPSPAAAVPPAARRRPALGPWLLVLVVVGATFVGAFALRSRRGGRIATPPAAAPTPPTAAAPAAEDAVATPGRWPWRGVTIAAGSGALPADVAAAVAALGPRVNYVRLTLDGRTLAERDDLSPEAAWSASLDWADAMLDACRAAGVVATVVLNQVPLDAADGVTETSAEFWRNDTDLNEAVRLAGQLAEHLRPRGAELAGYEVLPKPLVLEGSRATVPATWPSLLRRIVAEIRRHDADRWIVVTPGPGGLLSGYRDFAPLDDRRLVYAGDVHVPFAYTHQGLGRRASDVAYPGPIEDRYWDEAALAKSLHALRQFQVRYRVPVLIDEFGCVPWAPGRARYLADLAGVFGSYGWGWAYLDAASRGPHDAATRWKDMESVFARFGAEPSA